VLISSMKCYQSNQHFSGIFYCIIGQFLVRSDFVFPFPKFQQAGEISPFSGSIPMKTLSPSHLTSFTTALLISISWFHALAKEAVPEFKIHPHPPDVKLASPPRLEDPEAFSIIVLGDPQSYVKFDVNQPIFELLTAWTAAQKNSLNVKTVICTGDLVEQNDISTGNGGYLHAGGRNGNQTGTQQWRSVSRAFERLDGVYPYVVTTGNHDYGIESAENRNSKFPEYFQPKRNSLWEQSLVATTENAFGKATLENAAYEFNDKAWGDLLVVVLEFSPRDEPIEWARQLVSSEKYANHKVILLTHSFLNTQGEVIEKSNYKLSPANHASQILERLVKPSKNINLVICGHSGDPKTMSAFRTEKNSNGDPVHIMMFNPQATSGWNGNGGDGWLRILEFKPDGKTVKARTYSPLFAASQKTESLAWSRQPEHEFQFTLSAPANAE
jgi:predicted MPP superfamily phosphohydrolase